MTYMPATLATVACLRVAALFFVRADSSACSVWSGLGLLSAEQAITRIDTLKAAVRSPSKRAPLATKT
eukprot:COSAG02_NODE_43_length_45989_cov_93.430181_3_plen_68_part_00